MLEDEPEAEARGEEVQIAVAKTVTEVSPAAIEEDTVLLRLDTELDAHPSVSACPILTIDMISATGINVRCQAQMIDRHSIDQAAAEIVNGGLLRLRGEIWSFLCGQPRGVHPKAEIARKEIIDADAAAPAMVTEDPGLVRAFAHRVLTEEVNLPFVLGEADDRLGCLIFLRNDGSTGESAAKHANGCNEGDT